MLADQPVKGLGDLTQARTQQSMISEECPDKPASDHARHRITEDVFAPVRHVSKVAQQILAQCIDDLLYLLLIIGLPDLL